MIDNRPGARPPPGPPARPRWHRIGYALTLAWFVAVVLIARGDREHPLHRVMFTAPLAGWILAMIAHWLVGRRRAARRGGEE